MQLTESLNKLRNSSLQLTYMCIAGDSQRLFKIIKDPSNYKHITESEPYDHGNQHINVQDCVLEEGYYKTSQIVIILNAILI